MQVRRSSSPDPFSVSRRRGSLCFSQMNLPLSSPWREVAPQRRSEDCYANPTAFLTFFIVSPATTDAFFAPSSMIFCT